MKLDQPMFGTSNKTECCRVYTNPAGNWSAIGVAATQAKKTSIRYRLTTCNNVWT